MATAPTDSLPESLYASLTADMIRRPSDAEFAASLHHQSGPRRPILSENARLFAATWAGGFVFFFTFLS